MNNILLQVLDENYGSAPGGLGKGYSYWLLITEDKLAVEVKEGSTHAIAQVTHDVFIKMTEDYRFIKDGEK